MGERMQNPVAYKEQLAPKCFPYRWSKLRIPAEGATFSTNIWGEATGFCACLNFKSPLPLLFYL